MPPRAPTTPLFPYTTLFRSDKRIVHGPVFLRHLDPLEPGGKSLGDVLLDEPFLVDAGREPLHRDRPRLDVRDRKSTRLNSSHLGISYAVFCLKKKKQK